MSLPQTPSGGIPRLRRGALAVTAVAFSLAALSACSAGMDAQTLGVRPDNAEVAVDAIKIQNAVVITQPKADAEGPAVFSAKIFNSDDTAQTIDSITLKGAGGPLKLAPAKGSGPVTVPAEGSVLLGGAGNASAVLDNGQALTKNIGGVQEVVVRFSETGDVKMQAFIQPSAGYFQGFGPSALPKPPAEKPAETPPGEPSGTPGGPEGKPSESASGQAGEPGNGQSGEPGTPSDSSSASQQGDDAEH